MIDVLEAIQIEEIDSYIDLKNKSLNETITLYNELIKNYKAFVNNYNKELESITDTLSKKIDLLYDNMNNCYSVSEINKMFGEGFENILNKMKESINEKGIIDNDEELKQIRNEFNYIKKVFKLFPLVDCAKFKEITDEMIIKVNPDKLPVNKKKKNEVEGNNLINNVVREGKNKKAEETKG